MERRNYDCDTFDYWCSEEEYNRRVKQFGTFTKNGSAYRIDDPDTPRPWLNYFANPDFGSVVSNRGLGFTWYRSTLLRATKYEHPIDYLPRQFEDGREIIIIDRTTGANINVLRDAHDITCTHEPHQTTIEATIADFTVTFRLFVPLDLPCECWLVDIRNNADTTHDIEITCSQTWSIAKFGIHTAEEGIPYISTPGKDLAIDAQNHRVTAHSSNDELPYPLHALFASPEADAAWCRGDTEHRRDGRIFTFYPCGLQANRPIGAGASLRLSVVSGITPDEHVFNALKDLASAPEAVEEELARIETRWSQWLASPQCELPDKHLEYFVNAWFKNQLQLVFHFVRSGHNGYRDALQDAWGFALLDPEAARERLIEILRHQCADGTAPRNFSAFGDGNHDMRRFMDSPVWIPRTLIDLIKETGEIDLLNETVPFLDGSDATVDEHVWRAITYLFEHRGVHGACLTGDGDWNDALEGISRDGDAESVWLTIALFDAICIMIELYEQAGRDERVAALLPMADTLRSVVNENAWDGRWFLYGFTGSGNPIGSASNKEGRIHLNAQTWAVLSGIADSERATQAMDAVEELLDTPVGPALLAPPYDQEGAEVGRIANLEPGTFENASVYQHAVAFAIAANLALGDADKAYDTLAKLLPTNPDNFDCRRTSEPYCTGNYYCGPDHPRFGQNFFTWFTGNAAWLLRIVCDDMLGVKAGFDGLQINPRIPEHWNNYIVHRRYRGCDCTIRFRRDPDVEFPTLTLDGKPIEGDVIPPQDAETCEVVCTFS
jgi:cellobiose phosphorylase